jgi:recombinational DNA repair protein RecR
MTDNEVTMFDKNKGTCQHCQKPTRSTATSLCTACYKMQICIVNNPKAAESILREVKGEDN